MEMNRRWFFKKIGVGAALTAISTIIPKDVLPFQAMTLPFKGRIPNRLVMGDYIEVPLYNIREPIAWTLSNKEKFNNLKWRAIHRLSS
jgi:hypothetical protein